MCPQRQPCPPTLGISKHSHLRYPCYYSFIKIHIAFINNNISKKLSVVTCNGPKQLSLSHKNLSIKNLFLFIHIPYDQWKDTMQKLESWGHGYFRSGNKENVCVRHFRNFDQISLIIADRAFAVGGGGSLMKRLWVSLSSCDSVEMKCLVK